MGLGKNIKMKGTLYTPAQAAPVVAPAPVAVNGKKRGASDDEAPPVKAKVAKGL